MCIYRITRRLTSKKRFSCLVRSPRLSILAMQALILSVIFHAPLRAQAPYPGTFILGGHRDEFDVMEERIRKSGLGYDHQSPEAPPENAKVSVDELRYPLTEKARRILIKALNYIQKGDHPKAIATIKEGAAKVHAVVPYTHGLLGIEYMRTGRVAEAVAEFTESAALFPHDAGNRSNLALSLLVTGQLDRAEQEIKVALYLDPTMPNAQEIAQWISEDRARVARRN